MRRNATRADVAEAAGVSPAVVSYVLNPGMRPVAPATKERVLRAMEELGYRANANARALRSQVSRSVGLVVPDISNPFFAELAGALEEAAYAQGRTLLVGSSHDDPEREARYVMEFLDRRVDGMMLVSVGGEQTLNELVADGTPFVLLDREVPGRDDLPYLGIDNDAAGKHAVAHLISHGHQRVACIAGPSDQAVANARVEGWRRALSESDLKASPSLLVHSDFSVKGGFEATRQLLSTQDFTALFVSSDSQAQGAVAAIERAGLRIPEDVAVVGFDGTSQTEYSRPSITVVSQPIEDMAAGALAALERIQSEPISATYVPFALTRRSSCGC